MMAKKIDEADVKKECPSCGLGVPLDATVCEFCGWDFEEEDEWIVQIEKLERDLLLEKQKFEPGTVNAKIESTLHTPAIEKAEAIRAKEKTSQPSSPPPPSGTWSGPPKPVASAQAPPSPATAPATQESPVRRVRAVKTVAPSEEAAAAPAPTKKVRMVRKVKQ